MYLSCVLFTFSDEVPSADSLNDLDQIEEQEEEAEGVAVKIEDNANAEEEDEDDEDDDDSDYEYKSRRTTRNSKNRDKGQGLACRGCQRRFGSQGNLNKHLGHFKKCKKAYEEAGDLPGCFTGQKRIRLDGK